MEVLLDAKVIAGILGVLLSVSELLALNPKIEANSLFQLAWSLLKKAKE